jgi:hypothetical protein
MAAIGHAAHTTIVSRELAAPGSHEWRLVGCEPGGSVAGWDRDRPE